MRVLSAAVGLVSIISAVLAAPCDLSGNWTDASATDPVITPTIIIDHHPDGSLTVRSTDWLGTAFSGRTDPATGVSYFDLPRALTAQPDTPGVSPHNNPNKVGCSYLPALGWCRYPYCPSPPPPAVVWPSTPLHCAANPPCAPPTWEPTYQLNRSTVVQPCNASGPFTDGGEWGLVSYDWNNQRDIWSQHNLNSTNCSQTLVAMAKQVKEVNPDAKVFVYRNLELALQWLATERDAMNDPSKSDFFLKTAAGDIYNQAREYGNQYFWNFSNPAAVDYFINQAALGEYAVASPYVDGIYTDDVAGTFQEHPYAVGNLSLTRQEFVDIHAANAAMYTKLIAALRAHTAFNWQGFGNGDEVSTPLTAATCNASLAALCTPKWHSAPMLMGLSSSPADWDAQIAAFLVARGDYWWVGYGWQGCNTQKIPPHPSQLNMDVGEPVSGCTYNGDGVWSRTYSKGTVKLNCNTWTGSLPFHGA